MSDCLMACEISPDFSGLKDFVCNITTYFEEQGRVIHSDRNIIKRVSYHDEIYIVKLFKELSWLKKIVYTCMRPSKSKKSYINSIRLGDLSPQPVAYIDFYRHHLLFQNFFITREFDYDFTIREPLLDKKFADRRNVLTAFARFTAGLHEKKICHHDYSPGNILIKRENDGYLFKIIDVNRMSFAALDRKKRMKSFARLWADDEDLIFIITEYAKDTGENERECVSLALRYSAWQKKKVGIKKGIRARLGFLKKA